MMIPYRISLILILVGLFPILSMAETGQVAEGVDRVVYEGESGPGKGKHILFIASDHEYRGEEACPAIARILAKRYGFKCTVLFGQTEDGVIKPGSSFIPGIETIDDADMLFLFLRFLKPNDEWMGKFESYLKRGGPVLGLRTTTHAFNGIKGKYKKYNYSSKDKDFIGGFGRQILGETWNPALGAGHYGTNHKYATALNVVPKQSQHPVMLGVKDMHAMAGAYSAVPMPNSTILATNRVLQSMKVGAAPIAKMGPQPAAWVRNYSIKGGKEGRAFCSTQGASEDILSEGVRRMFINATLWCMGMENVIKADADVSFVGPYNPSTFEFKPSVKDARPGDISGWDTPILKPKKPANTVDTSDEDAQTIVRIELKGDRRTLSLSEVEVFSGGKNEARNGTAKQSSDAYDGTASGAIDGKTGGGFKVGEMTHTATESNPWWEVALNGNVAIESVNVWNRNEGNFGKRLEDFALSVLDSKRKVVFTRSHIAAPKDVVAVEIKEHGKLTYFDRKMKAVEQSASTIAPTLIPEGYKDPSPFVFKENDVVAFVGNGLADRMQHDGWLETLLQSELKDKNISFRNLAQAGDLVDKAPRSSKSLSRDQYLHHVKADVIFVFFGYNESYDGVGKAAAYQKKLQSFVKIQRSLQPNGKSFPRIVLFSPIAYENFGNPNLPDGVEHNVRVAAYTEATRKAAAEAGVAFVDIYTPSLQLYESRKEAFTINGIHLNEDGNKSLGEVISSALFNKTVKASSDHAKLRDAVKEKNWNWHNRYRATDGNDVWGSRAKFFDNHIALEHELSMLDVRTANRDKLIWATAKGESYKVDDSNVPPPVVVKTNLKVESNWLNKDGSIKYLKPSETIKQIEIPKGYKLNVFASEEMFPDLANPVQMQVDSKGRVWVASWNTYPKWEPGKKMNDSLMVFIDEDNDGVADKRIIFAHVHNPVGFEFWNGGVLVISGTDLLFLKDTDGDDVADVRYSFLQGFGTSDTHHSANNFIYGPDGSIYWQSGVFLVNNHEHPWGKSLYTGSSAMYRFDPRRHTINIHASNSPNPHGLAYDYWGYSYANDGTLGRAYQVRPSGEGFKMFGLLKKEVRPVAGVGIMSSAHLPEDVQGNYMICNTIGFLGVKNYKLHREGFPAKKKKLGEMWGTPETPFLVSKDPNVRPTDAIVGSDGALYISDWHNAIIGHMQHNMRDPNRDHNHGRIYRLTFEGRPLQKAVAIDGESIEKLLENLKHPINGVRHRTRVELSERDSDEVIVATRKWMKAFDASKEDEAHHLLEALWMHQQHNMRDEALLKKLLKSPIAHARIAAETVKHFWHTVDSTSGRTVIIEQEKEKVDAIVAPKYLSKTEAKQYKLGGEVFRRESHCATCHQNDGKGLANVYPPLINSQWVSGSEERLVKLTLHGLWGKIEVNGKTYDPSKGIPPMTAFGALLDDKEMASVLTYVRNSWGNKAPAVKPSTVKRVRQENEKRTAVWTPEELLKKHPLK